MSEEGHEVVSNADAGASNTFLQQADTIKKRGYIVIKNRPCQVTEVSTIKIGKHGSPKRHIYARDIYDGKVFEDYVSLSHNYEVPYVNETDYQLINISEDGFLSLSTENGNTKDDLKLPTDDVLLTQIKDGFAEGKKLVVIVKSAMGEDHIMAVREISP